MTCISFLIIETHKDLRKNLETIGDSRVDKLWLGGGGGLGGWGQANLEPRDYLPEMFLLKLLGAD